MNQESRKPWVPTREDIEAVARDIAEKFGPERIILFGSYAYGTPTDDSDVDFLVVMDTDERPHRVAGRILAEVRQHFPMDVIVRTPQELEYRIGLNDWFLKEITEKGQVLYECDHAGVDNEG